MLGGEIIVGIVGVVVALGVALPSLVVVAQRSRRKRKASRQQQVEDETDAEDALIPRPASPLAPAPGLPQGTAVALGRAPNGAPQWQTVRVFEMTLIGQPSTTPRERNETEQV